MQKLAAWLDQYFHISEQGSTIATECRAGFTTFLTMLYILVVSPAILSHAIQLPGLDLFPELMTTTVMVILVGCVLMGCLANYPFAVAPGMGLNAFFAYSVVVAMGLPWQVALGCVFLGGLLFIVVTLTGLRAALLNAIPDTLKKASVAGIGLFLGLLGFTNAGIVVSHSETLVTLGDLSQPGPLLSLAGLVITAILMIRRIQGAILLGIVAITGLAIVFKVPVFDGHVFQGLKDNIVHWPVWPKHLILAADIKNAFSVTNIGVIFSFFFVGLFDTFGSMVALTTRGAFVGPNGHIPRLTQAFMADATTTTLAGLVGCSTSTPFIESAAGIEEGGRTGLTAIVIAGFFLVALCFWPLASLVPAIATAPVVIMIGAMMASSASEIKWDELRESIPAFLIVVGIPLTYSIADGVALGLITYVLIRVFTGEAKKIHPVLYLLAGLLCAMLAL